MRLGSSPRVWLDAISWHVRGVFASEANRRVGFWARNLWQPAEIEARRGIARNLAGEAGPELRIDPETGYRLLSSGAIPDVTEVCRIGRAVADGEGDDRPGARPGDKMFFRYRVATEDQRATLLRLALDRRLLAMIAGYMGVLPVITEADFYLSSHNAGPFTKSQLWHCDDDAKDVIKIFIYCEDVGPENGPFDLIEAGPSRQVRDAVGYRYAGRRYRVSDAVMDRHVRPGNHIAVTGPQGTAFVVDTVQCFHRGSRIVTPGKRRVAAMVCYTPPSGRTLPRRLANGTAPLVGFADRFSDPLDRAVLGMPLATKWV